MTLAELLSLSHTDSCVLYADWEGANADPTPLYARRIKNIPDSIKNRTVACFEAVESELYIWLN